MAKVTEMIQKRGLASKRNQAIKKAEFYYAEDEQKVYVGTQVGASTGLLMESEIGQKVASLVEGKIPLDQLPDSVNQVHTAQTIEERDAIDSQNRYDSMRVMVMDASGDPTVVNGWAIYAWMSGEAKWEKIQEKEGIDLIIEWSTIQGKPTSSVVQIDDAVTKRHSHANKGILDATTAAFTLEQKTKLSGMGVEITGAGIGTATADGNGKMVLDLEIPIIDGGEIV